MSENENQNSASAYVHDQLERTRKQLNTARIVSIILIVFVATYMGCITSKLNTAIEPKELGDTLVGYAESMLEEHGVSYINELQGQIPQLIQEKIPELVMSQITPMMKRMQLQEGNATQQMMAEKVGPFISKSLNAFLKDHNDDVEEYFNAINEMNKSVDAAEKAKHKAKADEIMETISSSFSEDLRKMAEDEEFQKQLMTPRFKSSLTRLKEINADLAAYTQQTQNLSAEEKRMRSVIAMILDQAKWSTDANPRRADDVIENPLEELNDPKDPK